MAQELADKIRAAAQARNIDPDIALAIAKAESSLRPTAQAGTSTAGGLFQVVDKTWKEFGGKPGKKMDADENIRVGTDIIAKNTQTLKSFLNRDPRPAEVYAAHYFGPTGAKSFLTADPATPIVDILGKAAVKANPNLQGKTAGQVLAQLETKMGGPKQPDVSRETPTPAARKPLPPSLPPMAAAEESSAAPSRLAALGPGYQAALALSFLSDTDEKEDRDIDREPGIAEKWLAEQAPRPAALGEFADISIKSPFAPLQPQQPQMLADGGEVQHMSRGGLPFIPSARVRQSARRELDSMKAQSDRYNAEVEAYNKATEAWNAGPREQDFTMAEPVAPNITQEMFDSKAQAARRDAQNRNQALQVAADPSRFGFNIDRLFADGGEVEAAPDAGRPTVSETHMAKTVFPDMPVAEAVYLLRGGQRQSTPQGEMLMGNLGARVPMGRNADAMLMLAGSRPERDMAESKALLAAFNKRVGDEGGLNLNVVRPLDAPPGIFAGGVSGSYPLGDGRVMGNVNALKLPGQDPRITGYGVGYGGRVGPGNLSAQIMKQKDGPYSGQIEYRLPIGRAEGGEVKEPLSDRILKAAVPMDLRILGSTLMGNREPITEANFNQAELAAMQQAVDKAAARTGKTQKGSVQYVDYPRGEEIGPGFQPVGQTLGRFVYEKSPTGQTIITDRYDFYNEGRKANVEKYEKMGRGEKALSVSGNMLKNLVTGNLRQVPAELAEAYIGRDGREVRIQLPVKRADGGPAELTAEEIAAASRPATVNPNIQRQGEAARRLAAMRDVNTLPDPRTYAAVSGFLGTAPDQQGFSALHPDIQGIKKAGDVGFGVGTALQVAPLVGGATKVLGKAAGSALNERMLAGQSLTPGFNTPAPIAFAVKPRGGTFGYTGQSPGVSKLDYLMDEYVQEAKSAQAPSELQEFLKAKAPKYFSTTYGTAEDPLRTAIRERRIEPFGRDQSKLPPYLVDAAKFPQARGHLQAKLDLERMYDEMTGVRAYAYKPEGSAITERGIRQDISEKMGQEGVPIEARNPPSVDTYSAEEFVSYPTSSRMLRQLVENQETLPPNLQQALRTGEPIFDVDTNMFLLRPSNVIEALQQVPANKLKNMSFPEALIQGTQALAPIRDYRTAIDMAERGAKIPRQALDMFTQPVAEAPFIGGNWVQLTKPVATELEGKLMKHSVGGYGSGSSYGTGYTELPYGGKKAFDEGLVQVYSLRDKQGMPSVTVELAKSDKGAGDKWNVTQIRGRFNSEPPFQLREDIFRLLDKLDEEKGLNKIKGNTYNRTPTGEDIPAGEAPSVDWAQEYDQWLSGTAQ